MFDTICAVATAAGEGALSMVRISGEGALSVAEKVFLPFGNKAVAEMAGYSCAYGRVVDNGERIDDAVLTVFRAPHSYTGEDCAEISCHGGRYVTERIFRLCCQNGARPAQRGEFTQLALINGKLTLTQAEAVAEMIAAQGELTMKAAGLARQGRLAQRIDGMKRRLTVLLGKLAAWVDYPEEETPEVTEELLLSELTAVIGEAQQLAASYDTGMLLRRGIPAAIIGKPNVGKSTLMNLLLGYDRAIVTGKAGTTRDVLEESVRVGDVTLRLADTAGLRETEDEVERIGVELARKRLSESALLIAVFDGSAAPDEDDRRLIAEVREYLSGGGAKALALINKSDISDAGYVSEYEGLLSGLKSLCISAKVGDGQRELEQAIGEMYLSGGSDDGVLFVNERQRSCLDRALRSLRAAEEALGLGMTFDAVGIEISEAAEALAELTGERVTDSVVDEVFSKFCVGK
ncbi:MAG: tRNA uridine-5-carboxymethylaminomethyl(34) synthesis GTPase MnmE [Ruminococcus sp.]|nr:tRNA uridine-5-carboxymethylaminomethyl(34) synthesis GTPase MnmE [Ruminococcus sp.]